MGLLNVCNFSVFTYFTGPETMPSASSSLLQSLLICFLYQGPQPEAAAAGSSGGGATDAKPSSSSGSGATTEKVSTDKYRNYAVLAGAVTALGAIGWYLKASKEKPEVQD